MGACLSERVHQENKSVRTWCGHSAYVSVCSFLDDSYTIVFKVKMVVDTRIELVTPAMSMQCSTAELIDHLYSSTAQIGLCEPSVKQIAYV